MNIPNSSYRGRLAPSPTGLMHRGHARTFWVAAERTKSAGGILFMRNDDLDRTRCRDEFVAAYEEDLHWLGLEWELPRVDQSARLDLYRNALRKLHDRGQIYPCHRSRREVAAAVGAPHENGRNDEPIFPRAWRPARADSPPLPTDPIHCNWRFRVPDDQVVVFEDRLAGSQSAVAGRNFGDFLVWRRDGVPSYQLACAVDDAAMNITEVVRGQDLIKSTFRQILLLEALAEPVPTFGHTLLLTDESGDRLAKRHDALSLRALREQGVTPDEIIASFSS